MSNVGQAVITPQTQSKTALAAQLPQALRDRRQWCVASFDKRPLMTDGRPASVTDPSTWTDFDSARQAGEASGLLVGFVLTDCDPFTCIDLDAKEDTFAERQSLFGKFVSTFDSYTERSSSGRGLHIWVEGKIGRGRRSRDGVEVYSQNRFIICTGDVVHQSAIFNRQALLETLICEMGAQPAPEIQLTGDDSPDYALAQEAVENEGELGRLFAGDWEGRYPSQSEADLALVKRLLPHALSPLECWRTFQLSKLGRRDKAKRRDYAESTLAKAAQHLANDAASVEHGRKIAENLLWPAPTYDPRYFRLLSDDDLRAQPPYRWLVKGIIPDAGIGTIFGQSGTFKSFVALDLMAHVANGQQWFGRKVNQAPAVYVPLEGQGGIPKRVAAWRRRQQGQNVTTNMRFITDPMNLRQQAHRDKLVATVTKNGWAGGLLCIDTLAQAGPGIDENSSQGMGEMIAIFQELQRRLGGVILIIHHSGKFEGAGMRGWSGLLGAIDFGIRCWRDKEWIWSDGQFVLEKVKDGETGSFFDFSMIRVPLGWDEDGDEITSLTVAPSLREKEAPQDDAQTALDDDAFVDAWIRKEMVEGRFPTGRSLDSQRPLMKAQRVLTQKRLRDAVDRLKVAGRLTDEPNGPSGNKWLRATDALTNVAR